MTELDQLTQRLEKASLKDVRETGLDKFYTKPEIAFHCLEVLKSKVDFDSFELFLEPSAGNGSFLLQLPPEKRMGLDISLRILIFNR